MKISIEWYTADVLDQAKSDGIKLNEFEANQILKIIKRRYDANNGVTYETISSYIADYNDERNKKSTS